MSPKEYDCITYSDFELKVVGFKSGRDWYENIFRTVAFIIFKGYADPKKTKTMTLEKFWPMKDISSKKSGATPLHKDPNRLREVIQKIRNGTVRN